MERPRPTDDSEEQLKFRKQRAVRWLDPRVLVRTGAQSMMAEIFAAFADKRELQGTLTQPVFSARTETEEELWFDFVADLGDGFDATYSIASLLAASELQPEGATRDLPRGRLLVMGGDQVYPAASTTAYEERTKGVYRAALPVAAPDGPRLFALPGNHDWYDGLTSFLRVFAQQRNFGGWSTEQTRSYFAVALPRRWWLFAIDTQFDDYVDKPQLDYFREVPLEPGDAVILCTSKPSWLSAGSGGKTKGYDTIEFFQREIIRPRGATVPVMLTGDKHHFAHYQAEAGGRHLITCGLGGAYLSSTHRLPESLDLPPASSVVSPSAPQQTYTLREQYPAKKDSKRLARGVLRLPWRNPLFWLFTGVVQTVMSLAVLFGIGETVDPTRQGGFSLVGAWAPTAILAVVLGLGGVAFARLDLPKASGTNWVAGVLHAVPHLALSTGWAFAVHWFHGALPTGEAADWWTFGIFVALTPTVIGFLDAEIVAAYLWFASGFDINSNELFAAQSIEDHKGFLRLHIDDRGTLWIYPIALPEICRRWTATPNGAPTDPWLVPTEPLAPELIGTDPIEIPHP
ncbi:MAG: metallophosphoesterase [Actinophytocola sp.]|uniref:metallophosphoesterase n=1 Tax=Actinophytocola sp. TaxID=1872138 RepID=UPI003D6C68D9